MPSFPNTSLLHAGCILCSDDARGLGPQSQLKSHTKTFRSNRVRTTERKWSALSALAQRFPAQLKHLLQRSVVSIMHVGIEQRPRLCLLQHRRHLDECLFVDLLELRDGLVKSSRRNGELDL